MTKVLVKQSEATRKNGLSLTGDVWGNQQTITTGNENSSLNHRHPVKGDWDEGTYYEGIGAINGRPPNYQRVNVWTDYCGELNHTHSFTFTPSVSQNLGMSDGDAETRPSNYTIKVWKRTA